MGSLLGGLPLASAVHGAAVTEGFKAWAPWLVLFLPLAVAAVVAMVPPIRKRGTLAAALAVGGVLAGFALTTFVYFLPVLGGHGGTYEGIVDWIRVGDVVIPFGTRLDALALVMTMVVTGIGSAIFIYALGYMHGDESMGRFYGKFSLFVFSMLGIVLSPNFFQTFVFWELVGLSSYLLIGYYWKKHSAGEAAKKAFLTNRVGDFGFLLGILMVWTAVGQATGTLSFDFEAIRHAVAAQGFGSSFFGSGAMAGLGAILVFCGCMGKSAQFPLHVWLPDAMEGPTPVSALMHAATMVAAGIYMMIRCFFVLQGSTWAPTVVAWLGGITAFIAATMAITQRDIKKVLAYSTLSQLGYMTMALGAGAYTAAMFHLTTHACFKALLFLCAGSVIHGCHHEQDMKHMGGLKSIMPSTYRTWMIGTLALTAVLPIAGWWSKDEILGSYVGNGSIAGGPLLLLVGLAVAGMTAFYMFRATHMTFSGTYRGHHEAHESPRVMTGPLWALAVLSLFIGFVGIPNGTFGDARTNLFEHLLHDWHVGEAAHLHVWLAVLSTAIAIAGALLAGRLYRRSAGEDPLPARLGGLWTLWANLWYVDRFYLWLVRVVQQGVARACWWFERQVLIQGVINGLAQGTRASGNALRMAQGGRLGGYVTSFVVGVVLVLLFVLAQLQVR